MTRSITVAPGQSMSDVLAALKIAAGDALVIEIPADASVLLTANEFRALSIAAERDDVDVSIYTEDPLRRQLATLFGLLIRSTERPSVAKRSRNSSATERTSVMNTSCRE